MSSESETTGESAAAPNGDDGTAKSEKKNRSFLRELPILILVALVLSFFLQTFIARVYLIPSESMEPTLHGCPGCTGDRIVVEKIGYRFGDPQPGDVIVFRGPESWSQDFVSTRSSNTVIRGMQELGSLVGLVPPDENDLVKRVIATGGQTVECCDDEGNVLVDGQPLDEPYVVMDFPFVPGSQTCDTALKSARCFGPVTVPEGNLWMMGDNRSNSADSRYHVGDELQGTIPIDNVIGKAVFIVLPPSRMGTISSPNPQEQ
ncbi:signal peptidase I [Rhodococcus sp. WMMA185]|uniref:signal peptidase I n=1 Tax=Rhodococcus sp. WMMA185 TaxID=679318 RepID=UPI0008785EA7|nr:signal peptidase I [Rhodococcus sp. WMMA185]AOW92366.1 signal peptidase I [Rhodococcus sp. WMMA185]